MGPLVTTEHALELWSRSTLVGMTERQGIPEISQSAHRPPRIGTWSGRTGHCPPRSQAHARSSRDRGLRGTVQCWERESCQIVNTSAASPHCVHGALVRGFAARCRRAKRTMMLTVQRTGAEMPRSTHELADSSHSQAHLTPSRYLSHSFRFIHRKAMTRASAVTITAARISSQSMMAARGCSINPRCVIPPCSAR